MRYNLQKVVLRTIKGFVFGFCHIYFSLIHQLTALDVEVCSLARPNEPLRGVEEYGLGMF